MKSAIKLLQMGVGVRSVVMATQTQVGTPKPLNVTLPSTSSAMTRRKGIKWTGGTPLNITIVPGGSVIKRTNWLGATPSNITLPSRPPITSSKGNKWKAALPV
jgi:hypothetical protein